MSSQKKYIDAIELGAILSIHPVTIRKLASENRIPNLKIGGNYRFNLDEILKKIWGGTLDCHSNVVQTTIRRLRKRLDDGFSHKLIRNIHGIGYCVKLPSS